MDLYTICEGWDRSNVVSKVWGYEVWHYNKLLCLKTLVIYPGHTCSSHRHSKYEVFTCLDSSPTNRIIITVNGKERYLHSGEHVEIPRNAVHAFRCEGMSPGALLEVSTRHEEEDSERFNVSHRFAGGSTMEFLGKVADMKGKKVLCVGDIALDVYERGIVERLSPEAPCPVLLNPERSSSLGCVGNVAANIKALGGDASVVCVVSDDIAGAALGRESGQLNIGYVPVYADERPTSVKTRFMQGNYQLLRSDTEETRDIDGDLQHRVFNKAENHIIGWKPDVVYLADYDKGVLAPDLIESLVQLAQSLGIIVVADPKLRHFSDYKGVDVLKPNEKHATTAMKMPAETESDMAALAEAVIERLNCANLLITRGGKGMYLAHKGGGLHVPARYVEVSELSGAGDTAGAALALGMAAGWSIEDAAIVANVAASLVVMKSGTAACTPTELAEALRD